MVRITLFWCFEKKIFLSRMMEFQVKFCHLSELRLWRTGMLFSTKSKCHKSNVRLAWMYRFCFYDSKVHYWWPNKCLKYIISSLNTLFMIKNWQILILVKVPGNSTTVKIGSHTLPDCLQTSKPGLPDAGFKSKRYKFCIIQPTYF